VVDEASHEPYLRLVELDRTLTGLRAPRRFSMVSSVIDAKEAVERELIKEIVTKGTAPVACSGARETAVIYPDGRVAGCELRDDIIGSLRETNMDLRPIWFSKNADAFRRTAGHVDVCRGCYHHCFISPAMFRTPTLWPKLLRSFLRSANTGSDNGVVPTQ
jgi:radical SAM protein with 4Fe4S-binding SPASM domain